MHSLKPLADVLTSGHRPPLSVLMPVYNARHYVEQAVRSVLAQTFSAFELLIIDDGSEDGTLRIVERLASEDERIRLVSRPNAGLVPTLNELLHLARADLVARMDADDICRPTRFEKQVHYMRSHPDCVVVGSRFMFIDSEGLPLCESGMHCSDEEVTDILLQPDIGILHPSAVMRRDSVLAVGGYTTEYPHVEDLDLFLRLGETGELANLPDVLVDYRLHTSSVTHTYAFTQHVAGLKAVKAACLRRGLPFLRDLDIEQPAYPFQTKVAMHRKWAWSALVAGNVRSARKHALRALALAPMSPDNLRLLACAVRGH